MRPLFSIMVCTHNRASSLCPTLVSLTECSEPRKLRWEVLVVDNGSTDGTTYTAMAYSERLPLRIAHQPVAGPSQARNRGVDQARGDWLIWIDQ